MIFSSMSLQPLENKALSRGIIGKSAPILAEITYRKSQQLVIEKGERLFKSRREDLLQRVTNPREPLDPLTQLAQLLEGGLRAAPPIKQRIDVLHDLTQFA